jgi:hypothetical protein
MEEAVEKLDYLKKNGPSQVSFDLKTKFAAPTYE